MDSRSFAPLADADSVGTLGKVVEEGPAIARRCIRLELDSADAQRPGSIYLGSLGAALLCLSLGEEAEGVRLWRAVRDERRISSRRFATLLEGRAGLLALAAAFGQADAAAELISTESHSVLSRTLALPRDECEVLYGRCGYLHALLFLRSRLRDASYGRRAAVQVIQQVLEAGEAGAAEARGNHSGIQSIAWPLLWRCASAVR